MTETKKVLRVSLTNKGPQAPQEEKRSILHRFTHPQEQEEARHQTCSRDLFHLVLHWREWSLHPHQPPPSRTPLPLSRHYKQPGGSKAECPAADITECIKADLQSYSAKVRTETSMSCVSLYIYYTAKQRFFLLFPSPEWQHSNMADLEFWVQSQRLTKKQTNMKFGFHPHCSAPPQCFNTMDIDTSWSLCESPVLGHLAWALQCAETSTSVSNWPVIFNRWWCWTSSYISTSNLQR